MFWRQLTHPKAIKAYSKPCANKPVFRTFLLFLFLMYLAEDQQARAATIYLLNFHNSFRQSKQKADKYLPNRLNMELDFQSLFGLLCTAVLIG
jgi:hypothetical protein